MSWISYYLPSTEFVLKNGTPEWLRPSEKVYAIDNIKDYIIKIGDGKGYNTSSIQQVGFKTQSGGNKNNIMLMGKIEGKNHKYFSKKNNVMEFSYELLKKEKIKNLKKVNIEILNMKSNNLHQITFKKINP